MITLVINPEKENNKLVLKDINEAAAFGQMLQGTDKTVEAFGYNERNELIVYINYAPNAKAWHPGQNSGECES